MNKTILVTGGAGYIGSHTIRLLKNTGKYDIVAIDNLCRGSKEVIEKLEVPFYKASIGNSKTLEEIFSNHKIDTVLHFAAYTYVGESTQHPLMYYKNNFHAPIVLLETMLKHECSKFVFSSTAATYGEPKTIPIKETTPQIPINPYGKSKLYFENVLRDFDHLDKIRSVSLRYFNACGASSDGFLGEEHDPETHLIPLAILAMLGKSEHFCLFGDDYDTFDGTCIRDFVHVDDLGGAHIKAIDYLESGGKTTALNLGTKTGYSIFQIIEEIEKISGKKVPLKVYPRRDGDPPILIAEASKAKEVLGWEPNFSSTNNIIKTALNWFTKL